MAIKHLHC